MASDGGKSFAELYRGLRASELCGLDWADIDDDSFTIRQGAQYLKDTQELKQRLILAPPKTKVGKRTIPLTPAMLDLLAQQRKDQISGRLGAGLSWGGGAPGFVDTTVFLEQCWHHQRK